MDTLTQQKVGVDEAVDLVNKWLDHKKIKPKKRESLSGMIDNLIDVIVAGQLSLDDQYRWHYNLEFPLGPDGRQVNELVFKARISDAELERHKRGIKGDDFNTQMWILLMGLTGEAIGIIKGLDSTDKTVAESIGLFFM